MDATSFELNVSLPADARFAETMRNLATHAARYAGCEVDDAEAYGATVERVVSACLPDAAGVAGIAVVVRRGEGPVEFLIACDRRVDTPAPRDGSITIAWIRESGRQMCRVAIPLT